MPRRKPLDRALHKDLEFDVATPLEAEEARRNNLISLNRLRDRSVMVVARQKSTGKMAGYVLRQPAMLDNGKTVVYNSYMYVKPEYRGKRVGQRLLSAAVRGSLNTLRPKFLKDVKWVELAVPERGFGEAVKALHERLGLQAEPSLASIKSLGLKEWHLRQIARHRDEMFTRHPKEKRIMQAFRGRLKRVSGARVKISRKRKGI